MFEEEKITSLTSGIKSRMNAKGLKCHTEYFNHLYNDSSEFHYLVNLLTINETYFFREQAHLTVFSEQLISGLLGKVNKGKKINILSAGCSTGEEPYSLVMSLLEKYGIGGQNFFSVHAADIDQKVLEVAKKGIYGKKSFRSIDENLKEKYFDKAMNDRFKIKDFIREKVEFHNVNLLSDSYPESLSDLDIIFYRNVSIYFDHGTQKKIFTKLAKLLNNNGYLIVSSTETFFHNLGILSLIELEGSFLYHKSIELAFDERKKFPSIFDGIKRQHTSNARQINNSNSKFNINLPKVLNNKTKVESKVIREPDKSFVNQKSSAKPLLGKSGKNDRAHNNYTSHRKCDYKEHFDEALSFAKNKKYAEALVLTNKLLKENNDFIEAYTLKVSILINLHQLQDANETCLNIIKMDEWHLEGYLLLGLISKIENNEEDALKRFKEALYIEPSCWLAHFYMAEIFNAKDELKLSYREYRIALTLLDKGNMANHGLTLFPILFPQEQLVHLCCHNISKLKERLGSELE